MERNARQNEICTKEEPQTFCEELSQQPLHPPNTWQTTKSGEPPSEEMQQMQSGRGRSEEFPKMIPRQAATYVETMEGPQPLDPGGHADS
uniref:Uncharacterized protein n=1 Tax=Caenorhabditis japonica TaxID=281687 RepID=A0A8R1ILJ1_CAEJA